MAHDTSTEEGRAARTAELVLDYTKRGAFGAIARLIGGSPRHDLQDYSDADAGEAPNTHGTDPAYALGNEVEHYQQFNGNHPY